MTGLQRKNITFPFARGIDAKDDAKQSEIGTLQTCQNATFQTLKQLTKRNGYEDIGHNAIATGGSIDHAIALMGYEQGLLLATRNFLYSYTEAQADWGSLNTWASTGSFVCSPQITRSKVAVDAAYNTTGYDMAQHANGLQCAVYERSTQLSTVDAAGGISYAILDSETGQVVLPATQISATGKCPKVVAIDSVGFLVTYIDTDVLYGFTIPYTGPTTRTSAAAYTSGAGTAALNTTATLQQYDIDIGNNGTGDVVWIAFNNNGGGTRGFTVLMCPEANLLVATLTTNQASTAPLAICVFHDLSSSGPVVAYTSLPGAVTQSDYVAYDSALTTIISANTIYSGGALFPRSISGVNYSASDPFWVFAFTLSDNANVQNDLVRFEQWEFYTRVDNGILARSVSLCGKVTTRTAAQGGGCLIPVVFDSGATYATGSGIQNTYAVLNLDGGIVARYAVTNAAGRYSTANGTLYAMLPATASQTQSTTDISNGPWLFPAAVAYETQLVSGVPQALYSLSVFTLDLEPAYLPRAELAGNMLLGGSSVASYDGAGAPVEQGFLYYPWILSIADTAAGTRAAGTYTYAVTYEWTDGNGNTQRSSPSVTALQPGVTASATSVPTVTVIVNHTSTLTIGTLRVTAMTGQRGAVQIVVWRTIASGTVFYRCGTVTNDTTVDTVTFADARTDAQIQGNAQLYTTGTPAVTANSPPPPTNAMVVHRNRVFAIDSTDRNSLWYTKTAVPGSPPEFSAEFTLNIDPTGGDALTLMSLDDKLIIGKADRLFAITGQGPADTGQKDDFSDAVQIATDCGCANQASIVRTPLGIMFQSDKGIYLLGRDLSVAYIGAPVEDFNSYTVTSATLIANTTQVRFTLSEGSVALVYDYYAKQWSTFTNIDAADACNWQGLYTFAKNASGSLSLVCRETLGASIDPGDTWIPFSIVTGWLNFAEIQGFQRVRRMELIGDFVGSHALTVGLAYDYVNTLTQTNTITNTSPPDPLQFLIHLTRQKCEALAVTISDAQVEGQAVTAGLSLSALSFEVAGKKGLFKLPAAQSVG